MINDQLVVPASLGVVLAAVLCTAMSALAQPILTPNGSLVQDSGHPGESLTPEQITYINSYVEQTYPLATRLSSATCTYNCHGYAWHMTEGGSQSWIGLTTETAHYIYWQDGSYVSKAEQKATKVKYSGNHSAVITSTPLVYESKWGCWPLMQHAPMYVPTGYGGPSAFYVRVLKSSINGPGCLVQGNNGYYAAYATGGKPPYSYSWQYRIDCDLESREFRMEGPPCGVWNHAGSGQQIYFGASQTQNFSIRATAYDNSDQSAISYNMYVHVQPFSCLSGALTSGDVPVNEQKAFLSSNTTRQSQPQAFDLDQNHPNPFNPITEVRFSLPEAAHVLLTIYDVVGRELARLVDQQTDAGYHTVTWDASNVPSGVYLCRFQANGFVKTQRMILLK